MPVNSRYNRPFTTTPRIPSAIATITSSGGPAAAHRSVRRASDPVVVKSDGQARFRTDARSEALSERNQLRHPNTWNSHSQDRAARDSA